MRFQKKAQYWSHWAFKLNALSVNSLIQSKWHIWGRNFGRQIVQTKLTHLRPRFWPSKYRHKMTYLGPKLWPQNCPCEIDTFGAKILAAKVSSQNDTFRAKALTTKLSLWNWHIWGHDFGHQSIVTIKNLGLFLVAECLNSIFRKIYSRNWTKSSWLSL